MKISDIKSNLNDQVLTCKTCGIEFKSKKICKTHIPKYCCKECYSESLRHHKKCILCGHEIENKHSVSLKHRKYCSKECQRESRKGKQLSEEWKKALSEGRKKSIKCKGENLYNWKGGESTKQIRMKQHAHKRRSSTSLELDSKFLERLLLAQKNKCFYCNANLTEYKAIEHLTPISRGGDNQNYNLVYSCKSCNSKKRNKTMEEYSIQIQKPFLIDKFDLIFSEAI